MEKETQELIEQIIPDQYSAIGKLHQIAFTFGFLDKNCTKAVDLFSNFDENDHQSLMCAVQESLDAIGIIEESLTDTKTILKWMRNRWSDIFE